VSSRWSASPRLHLALVLLAYAVVAAAVQVHCADLLTSDGECYLRMAVYYAKGDLRHAVFGHWSPLGSWLTTPLVAAGMVPRHAFRLWIGLWGALAVVGVWRLAGRFGMGPWLRAAATGCAALLVAEFSADHRVDLLLTALLLLTLDAAMDERLLASRPWALGVGMLGGVAYLSKLYALPFFAVHFTLVVILRAWAEGEASRQSAHGSRQEDTDGRPGAGWARRALRAWLFGVAGLTVVAAPWVGVLSAKYGRLTAGTAGATTYALYGPGSGDARPRAVAGLRKPPADAWNVWQDATLDATGPAAPAPSPLRGRGAVAQQLRFAWRNAALIVGHLAAADEFRLGLAALVLTLVLAAARWRRAEAFSYLVALLTVMVYCGGYAFVYAEDRRFFWFPMLVLTALVFHVAAVLTKALGRRLRERPRRLVMAAVAVAVTVSFAFHPVRFLGVLLREPPPGREHRLVAARLAEWGVRGPLASLGDRGWWDGLHTAYYLDAQYAGSPVAQTPQALTAEMRSAGATALLVWGRPHWAARLAADPAFAPAGTIRSRSTPGLRHDVSLFVLPPQQAARP